MDDQLIGRHVRGYEIRTLLGRGGYGAVYRAYQPAVGRDVAIKVILPQYAENPEFTKRFEVEAQLVAQLEHPYIVPLYDYWQDENGAFLVMRLVRGGSLRDQIKQNGPLSMKQVMRLYDHVGSALAIAHEAGVIHRDIKPDNILIDQYSNAYLTDFGIAKNINLNAQLTAADDEMIGTPAYLSPEQIKSMPVSPQTDIYSLGIMLYEVITGSIPFDKPGMQIIMQHLQEPVPSILNFNPDLPEALDDIVARASAKEIPERYQSVTELVEAVRDVFAPAVTTIIPPEAQPRVIKPNQHIFISYSRHDNEFIQRLIYDLESEGIPVWVDKKGLKPGTRNWEDALRNAIQNAYGVLYVASPASRRSPYVMDELAIAEMYNCPVYPLWADGEEWMDSIPMGMGKIQYIDARGDSYTNALMELVMILGTGQGQDELLKETDPKLRISDSFVPRNPYKGLRAFRQDDQQDFFGRTGLIRELVETLRGQMQPNVSRLLSVIGPSGSGKSSVVMAGLLPVLQRGEAHGGLPDSERWSYLPPMVPGVNPIENLAIALADKLPAKSQAAIREDLRDPSARGLHTLARQIIDRQNSRLIVYVDQFEELFTQTAEESDRQQFINLLLTAVTEPGGPVTVIVTMRADFYDRPMNYPELGKLIEANSKSVLPMSLSDLHDVIQKPAQLEDVLLQFDAGLVAELVFEVRDQIGGLPLLQFTLDQLFERRSGRRLTMSAYYEIGGVRGALARHTEATYEALPSDDHRRLARGLFLRLIEPGSTEQDTTRRRAPRNELVLPDPAQNRMMDQVIDNFVNARLLLTDQQQGLTTVEVSHEALIREWPRLAEWLNEARSDIAIQQAISGDCQSWISRGSLNEDDGLYRGMLLEEAEKWAGRNLPSQEEAEFIKASAKAQSDRKAKDDAIARRVQNFGRAAAVLGVMSVIALIALVASVIQVTNANSSLVTATIAQGLALVQVADAGTQVAVVGETLTPAAEQVEQASTRVADAGTQAAGAETQVFSAQVQVTEAQSQADAAETQVADANATQTPAAETLIAAEIQITAASTQVQGAGTQAAQAGTLAATAATQAAEALALAANAEERVNVAEQTLTPVPQTLTMVAQQLEEGDAQLSTAQAQVITAGELAADAGTQVVEARQQAAIAGETLTPVPLTLAAVQLELTNSGLSLATAEVQIGLANQQASTAQAQVDAAQQQVQDAQVLAFDAQTQVAQSNGTQTPVAATVAAGVQLLSTAAMQVDVANTQAFFAETQVAEARNTLTPIGGTVAAAETRVAGVDPTVTAANEAVNAARVEVTNAALTLAPIPLTLTPAAATLAIAEAQIAGVQPTLDAAGTEIAGVQPTLVKAQEEVAAAGAALTPLAATLVAAQSQAEESQKLALSQSLAVDADQAINNEDFDLALVLALESIRANPDLVQSQALMNSLVFSSARFSFADTPIAALSPDGGTTATANGSEAVLWDNNSRSERLRLAGHTDAINAIDFSPDGLSLLTASADGTMIIWDAAAGTQKFTLAGHSGAVNDAEFSRDNNSVISGGADNVNIWWNAQDGTERQRFTNGTGRPITRVKFYTNTTRFWSWELAGDAPIMLFWATDRANPLWTSSVKIFSDFEQENLAYAFRENDSSLEVTAWDTGSSNEVALRTLNLGTPTTSFGIPTAKAFSTNGSVALVAFANQSQGNTLVIEWNYSSNATTPLFTLQGVQRVEAITYDPSGTIAALGFGKQIILYDMVNLRELRRLSAHTDIVTSLRFSADGRYLLSRSKDNNTRLWDVTGGDPAEIARVFARTQNNRVTYPGLSPDARVVYSIQRNSVFGWNVSDNAPYTRDDAGDILSAYYSPDQPYALVVFPNVSFVYDMSVAGNPSRIQTLGSQNETNSGAAAWVPGSEDVAVDGNDLALRPVNARDAREVIFDKSSIADDSELVSLAVSPDGRYLIGVSARDYQPNEDPDPDEPAQNILVWNLRIGGAPLLSFGADQHNRRINHVAVSPDSTRLLSASNDGTLIVWDIETGRLLARLSGHRGAVNVGIFTPDNRYVLSASDDSSLIQWELGSGQPLRSFNGHVAPVTFLSMSANGRNFVSSTGDDLVIVWELVDIGETITWALQNRFIRQLSCDEGRQFNLTQNCVEGESITANSSTGDGDAEDSPFSVTPTATLEACFVSTTQQGIPVHTGPSTLNVIRFSLNVNQDFLVTGQETDSSGNLWWRLRWPEPSPGEENRYWVQESDVDEEGGCDSVGDADTVAAATAISTRIPANTGGSNNSGGNAGGNTQPTQPPVQPTTEACSAPLAPIGGFGFGNVEFSWSGMSSAAYYYVIVFNRDDGVAVFNDRTSGNQTSANLDTSGWTANNIDWTIAPIGGDGVQLCNPGYVQASR